MLLLVFALCTCHALAADRRTLPTPFGERPAECVVTLPAGATVQQPSLSMASDVVTVTLANGRPVTYAVPSSCHEDGIAEKYLQRRGRGLQSPSHLSATGNDNTTSVPPDGWYDNAYIWYVHLSSRRARAACARRQAYAAHLYGISLSGTISSTNTSTASSLRRIPCPQILRRSASRLCTTSSAFRTRGRA